MVKTLPHDIEREEAILGAMFLNPKIKPRVSQLISADDFYKEAHQHIFNALMVRTSQDLVSVIGELKRMDALERAGGADYVASVPASCATSAGYEYHCQELKKLSLRRKLIAQCMTTAEAAYMPTEEIEQVFEGHKGALREIQADQSLDYTPNLELVKRVSKSMEDRATRKDGFVGIRTGFRNLDGKMYGLEPGTLTILMARPSMGKTALALNIAENVAGKQQGKKALYINLESSAEALTRRRLAIGSDIPLSDIRRGILTDNQYTSFISAANEISASNLIIIEKPKFKDIRLLHSIVETFVLEHPISLITIDHFTKLFTSQKTHSSHHQFSLISNEITTIAKDLKVPVLLLCQLNRESEKRTNKRPVLSDLRETGSLEEDADNVIAIYRETKESEVAEIELLKGRDVGTFKTRLKFDRFCQRFDDCDEEESWDQNTAIYRAKI